MAQSVVSRPVTSAQNWSEEIALLFAQGAADEARQRVERARVRSQHEALDRAAEVARTAAEDAATALAQSERALAETEQRVVTSRVDEWITASEKTSRTFTWITVAGAVGALLLGSWIANGCAGFTLSGVATAVLLGIRSSKLSGLKLQAERAREEFEEAKKAKTAELESRTAARALAQANVDAARRVLDEANTALAAAIGTAAAPPTASVRAVVRGYLPFRVVQLAGYPVVLDPNALVSDVEVAMPNLVHDLAALKSIRERVQRFAEVPVLLKPDGRRRNDVSALYGEEEELRQTLEDWRATMQAIPVLRQSLPLLERNSPVAAAMMGKTLSADSTPGALLMDPQRDAHVMRVLAGFTACVERAREVGGDGEAALRETYEGLRTVLTEYGERRLESLRVLQANVHGVLSKASLLSLNCYCPRCNRIPEYLYLKLGVPFEEAHLADQGALVTRLQQDAEIRERVTAQPQLLHDLESAWNAIQSLNDDALALRQRAEQLPRAAVEQRLRAFASQQDALVGEYRACLRHVLLGSPRPSVELGRSSRLHLDPDTGAWTCAACQFTWTDPDVASMGRVLRVKDELLLPLWNHLWTEKEDFRKSEIFRTNEQLQRFSEKESEKLLGIAESYKGDLRGVRERIISATAEAETNRERLFSTLDGLVDMGLMTAERAEGVRARLKAEAGESSTALKRKAESNEMMLLAEPQAQLRRRPPAADPIRLFSDPASLFKNVPPLLSAPPEASFPLDEAAEISTGALPSPAAPGSTQGEG